MQKYFFFLLCICSALIFSDASFSQVPGTWEKHIICHDCSISGPIDFADENHGMLIGKDSSYDDSNKNTIFVANVYLTSDGGITWKKHESKFTTLNLRSLTYIGSSFASGFTFNKAIQITTDNGMTWSFTQSTPPHENFLCGQIFPNLDYYIFSTLTHGKYIESYLRRSHDTAQTFQIISDTLASGNLGLYEGFMQDSLNIWTSVNVDPFYNGISYLHTVDGGLHWTHLYPIGIQEDTLLFPSAQMIGNRTGSFYLVNTGAVDSLRTKLIYLYDLLFTTDGGASWQADSSQNGRLAFVANSGGSKLWAFIGDTYHDRLRSDTLAYTPNNGKNWYYDLKAIKGDSVTSMMWKDSSHGYIISYKNSTYTFAKYIPPTTSVEATRIVYFRPGDHPAFNVTPTITTGIIHLHPIEAFSGTMAIYDILGRLQFQSQLTASLGDVKEFSLSDLSRGMYCIVFSKEGHYSSVRVIKE